MKHSFKVTIPGWRGIIDGKIPVNCVWSEKDRWGRSAIWRDGQGIHYYHSAGVHCSCAGDGDHVFLMTDDEVRHKMKLN